MPHRRRFTIVELLVSLGIVFLLISIILPIITRMQESAGRQRCPSNLRQIGQAIQMYAIDNKGQFPRTVFDGAGGSPVSYTGSASPNPFVPGGPGPNDVSACLFLLLRTQDLTPEVFICPNVRGARPFDVRVATVQQVSNFPSRRSLTYSFTNPYASPAVEQAGFKLAYTLTSDLAIAADMNPGGSAVTAVAPNSPRNLIEAANTPNHRGDGQNVLYADGHVEFQNTPFCGVLRNAQSPDPTKRFRDNIYTHGAGWGPVPGVGVTGAPVDADDSVLLPTALDGPPPQPTGARSWFPF